MQRLVHRRTRHDGCRCPLLSSSHISIVPPGVPIT